MVNVLGIVEEDQSEPRLIEIGGVVAPAAPSSFDDCGIGRQNLLALCLKHAFTVQQFTTEWMIEKLCIPQAMAMDLLDELKQERLIEILGESGTLTYVFTISKLGRESAMRMMEISGYIGPAPVTLEDYTSALNWQVEHFETVTADETAAALSELVLSDDARQVIGLALMSQRSLFVHGPPGNGKTSVGRLLHDAFRGHLWIPHAISVGRNIIRLFDPQCHKSAPVDLSHDESRQVDLRWIRIERPFIVVGGELTIEALDLGHDSGSNFYEAPLHLKANGGTFLLDDFGRQRVEPSRLLNRWIIPLEHQVDYLTLRSGQKVQVPLRHMLVISTSLDPDTVVDPAFIRRIGYRLFLGNPTAEHYSQIFEQYVASRGDSVTPGTLEHLLKRYDDAGRSFRSSEPGELIERARDICRYQNKPMELNVEIVDQAWRGYFGERQ
ncbi:MAG: hypothetical protein VCD00_08635 [Candidatus Hydrogenedentota bacterium]